METFVKLIPNVIQTYVKVEFVKQIQISSLIVCLTKIVQQDDTAIDQLVFVEMSFVRDYPVQEMKNVDGLQVVLKIRTLMLKLVKIGDRFLMERKLA